jgi:hypothetical protein
MEGEDRMIDTDKYNIDDGVIWIWNDDLDQKQGWVLWEYKECPNGHTVGDDPNKTYSPHHQVLPALIFECKIDERMEAIMDLPLILAEVKKLQDKITLMEMQYVGLEQAYYNSPAETENKQLRGLLDAIYWDAFSEDDTTLEINREVAERVRRVIE